MASRRDELRAYQFLKQRAVSALVIHETDPEQPPFRRPVVAMMWGFVVAVLALCIAGAVGFFTKDDRPPTIEAGKTILVGSPSAARFVSLNGQLHPVLNYSSALLALGDFKQTQNVKDTQLDGMRRGKTIGIAGAPDQLPSKNNLLDGQWNMCTQSVPDGNGDNKEISALLVGVKTSGGTTAQDQMVFVTARNKEYVIWHGRRHLVTDHRPVTLGLGLDTETPIPVSSAWLDIVPTGTAFEPINPRGAGGRSKAFGSARPETRIGQIFERTVSSSDKTYYLATARDLMPLTETQMLIQLSAPSTSKAYPGSSPRTIRVDPGLRSLAKTRKAAFASDLPADVPEVLSIDTATATACASFEPGDGIPTVDVGPRLSDVTKSPTAGGDRNGTPLADYIVVPPGRGALVSVLSNANANPSRTQGTLAFVSDAGTLFPLSDADVVKMLGYDKVRPVRISGALAARLPHGPSLNPTTARKPVSG